MTLKFFSICDIKEIGTGMEVLIGTIDGVSQTPQKGCRAFVDDTEYCIAEIIYSYYDGDSDTMAEIFCVPLSDN